MFRSPLPLLVYALLCLPAGLAQSVTATLVGVVSDSSGAIVAQANVTLTSEETGETRTQTTGADGEYRFTLLRPGNYRLAVEKQGFKKSAVPSFVLQVDQTGRVDVSMQVGQVSESVEVSAAAPLVASETSSVGQVIDQTQIQSLPLRGRSFFELAQLAPGTSPTAPNSFIANRRPMPGGLNAPAFQVGGAREKSNGYLIDGVDSMDPHFLTPSIFPSVDAIQEFKLQTNSYAAEFGRFAAQVNATTRSGTNRYAGAVYHFFRNDKLDATNFFANLTGAGKQPIRYNQFGGVFGGPVRKDKTFFFVNYEGTRIRRGTLAQLNLPTEAQRNGDFNPVGQRANRPIFDPNTTRRLETGAIVRDPFAGNTIPTTRITNFAREVLKLYPAPNTSALTGNNFFAGLSGVSDNNQFMGKVDHRFNDANSLMFRYSIFDGIESSPSPIDAGGLSTEVRTYNLAASYIRTFTPSLFYELRMGYNRPNYLILQDGANGANISGNLGLRNLLSDPIAFGVPQITMTNFTTIGTDTNPTTQVSNVYHLVNHITWIRGAHTMKMGTDMRKVNYNDRSERFVRGGLTFTGGLTANPAQATTTGVSVADLLLGLPLSASGSSTSLAGNFNGFNYGFFWQDDWRVGRNLTLNLGVRFDYNTRFTDVQNRLSLFDGTVPGGRLRLSGTSKALVPPLNIVDGPATPRGLLPADRNNWAPRVGVAWRPLGGNRTVVRAGFGMFYDLIELQDLRTWVRNPPFGQVTEVRNDQNANPSAAGFLRVQDLFPPIGSPAARPGVFGPGGSAPDPVYHQWNMGVQQEIWGGTLVEVGYIGSKGTFLAQRINYNQATLDLNSAAPTPILSRRRYPMFGDTIRITENAANSTYHAGFVKVERRLKNGFSYLFSYTLSKSLDGASLIDDGARDIFNLRLNKSRSGFDIRHRPVVSGTWELPFLRGNRWLGGWTVNGIGSFRSGFPFSVSANGDVCNCGAASQLAQQVGDPGSGFTQSRLAWFNTGAFAQPERGRFGSSGRNILDGPGDATYNLSLFRSVAFAERFRLQLRGELFNAFNHTNFGQPNGQVGNANYGIIQSAASARVVQIGAKLSF
jgi:hypothetical protein